MRYDTQYSSIPGLVQKVARSRGETPFLIDGERRWSFQDLEQRMVEVARGLVSLGMTPGDRAALCAPNSAVWVQVATGIQAAGGILVPLSTRFKSAEIAHILRASDARVVFTAAEFVGNDYIALLRDAQALGAPVEHIVVLGDAAPAGCITLAELIALGASSDLSDVFDRIDALTPESTSDIMFTSGTTGSAKGVELGHGQSLQAYGWLSEVFTYQEGETFAVIPPFFHGFGYKAGWLAGLIRGTRVIPIASFDPLALMQIIQEHRVNLLNGPPTIFVDLMNHPRRSEFDLSSLRVGTTGAATIPLTVIEDMRRVLGLDVVINAYGLTESTALVSTSRPGDDPLLVATTVGRAAEGLEVKAVDESGSDVRPGEAGEILVRGYTVMRGYWNDDVSTGEAITTDGFLKTGDIGVIDENGFIRITDRKKDLFIVGGFNAYPAEIEAALLRFEKILHVAVIGVPDDRMGEVGWAYVVPKIGEQITERDVIEFARRSLANFKVPRRVIFLQELPRTPSLKVTKVPLKQAALAELRAEGS